jgi:putative flippase GtrA
MEKLKIALIPAYEPDDRLIVLLKELNDNNFKSIIVNDGSDKSYNKIFDRASKYGTVITYEGNKGKGHALKTGLKYIKNNFKNKYTVVTIDCDGQHKVKDALNLCNYVEDNYIILGKRIRNKKTPIRSKIGNRITKFIFFLVTGIDIYDTQTGLRAFNETVIDYLLNIKGEKYEYEMNVLLNCFINNIKVKEIEIETIYINNNSGSHFNTVKDAFKIYKDIFKFSLSSLICALIDYILFITFMLFSKNVTLSNIVSRIISASINYKINKKFIFNNYKSNNSLIKYFTLALCILILNTILLNVIKMYINKFIAKIIVEIILFFLSFTIQRIYIFRKKI